MTAPGTDDLPPVLDAFGQQIRLGATVVYVGVSRDHPPLRRGTVTHVQAHPLVYLKVKIHPSGPTVGLRYPQRIMVIEQGPDSEATAWLRRRLVVLKWTGRKANRGNAEEGR